VTGPRAGARRLIGAALLLPGLLTSHPVHTEAAAPPPDAVSAPDVARKTDAPKRTATTNPAKAKPQAARKTGERKAVRAKSPRAPIVMKAADDRCVHVVRARETVGRVAARYRVTRQAMIAENRLPGSAIKAGLRLTIPGCQRGAISGLVNEASAVELDHGLLLARVGPDRIPTRLFVAVPEFGGYSIEFSWPVDGPIASGFGRRRSGWHAGIDIQADMGARVLASAPGTVIFSGWAASYGRAVKIQHSNGFVTVYAHNHENLVQIGDAVDSGTVIASVGKSGRASSHHLHFEIRRDGMAFNPLYLLDSRDLTPVFASTRSESVSEPVEVVVPLEVAEPVDEDADE
jgi:murein DD-endopeptidase MepM/ murein hydrolase activator NlpD